MPYTMNNLEIEQLEAEAVDTDETVDALWEAVRLIAWEQYVGCEDQLHYSRKLRDNLQRLSIIESSQGRRRKSRPDPHGKDSIQIIE